MRKTSRIITDFTAGKLSSKFDGRLDIQQYYKGCSVLTNFVVLPSGGVQRRPGTHYVGETKNASTASKLVPFIANATTTFMCDFGNAYARFWDKNHNQATHNNNTIELSTSYNTTDIYELKYARRIDANNAPSMYFAHTAHEMKKLTYANSNFTLDNQTSWISDPNGWVSGSGNYPAAITFAGGRMVLGGSVNKPQTVTGSRALDVHNFNNATGANNTTTSSDAFTFDVDSEVSEQIRWMQTKGDILAGTLMGEWRANITINPNSAYIYKQTGFGSKSIQALVIGNQLLFVRRDGTRIMEYRYYDRSAAYESRDLSWMTDATEDGIKDWAFMQSPFPCVWCVTEENELKGLTYDPKHNVIAWHDHDIDGDVDSVAVLPTEDGADEVWLVVKRTIDGAEKRFVEYFTLEEPSDQRNWFEVDCGKTFDYGANEAITEITANNNATITFGNSTNFNNNETVRVTEVSNFNNVNGQVFMLKNKNNTTFALYDKNGTAQIDSSGYANNNASDGSAEKVVNEIGNMTHLNNETVAITADGGAHPNKTVSNNNVSLDKYFNTIHVGLGYTSTVRTMRMENAETIARKRRVNNVRLRFYKTLGGKTGPTDNDTETLLFRNGTDLMGVPPSLYTGDKELSFPGNYSREGYIVVTQNQALPMTLAAISVDMGVSD
jgi:hypothetical protein